MAKILPIWTKNTAIQAPLRIRTLFLKNIANITPKSGRNRQN
jgi:hypothetical protein